VVLQSASGGPQRDSRQRPFSAPASWRDREGATVPRWRHQTAPLPRRRRSLPRPSLRLSLSPRLYWPFATPTPDLGVVGMATQQTNPPMGRGTKGSSNDASVGAPGASLPAFGATPPPCRIPRGRLARRPGAGKCCFSAFTTTASWPRWALTSCPSSLSASSWTRERAPTWSAGTPSPLTGFAR